jgi:hypothetical protein
MAEPAHGYEIVGVLREIFGLADHDLAVFASKMWDGCRQGEGGGLRPADRPTGCKPIPHWQISRPVSGSGPVADTLNLLVETRARIIALPLFSAIEELVRATQLRERLLILPAEEFEDLGRNSTTCSRSPLPLKLRPAPCPNSPRNCAPALPRLAKCGPARPMRFSSSPVTKPRAPSGRRWSCRFLAAAFCSAIASIRACSAIQRRAKSWPFLDRAHVDETMKQAIETQQRQELERLLYVTLSRAKHTLVIVDDRALFQQRNGLPKNAAARLLGCAEATDLCTRFENLPTFAEPCSRTVTEQRTFAGSSCSRTIRRRAHTHHS